MSDNVAEARAMWMARVRRTGIAAALLLSGWSAGTWLARTQSPQPIVVTRETPEARPRSPRTGPPP